MPPSAFHDWLLSPLASHSKAFARLASLIEEGRKRVVAQNLQGSALAYFAAALQRRFPDRPLLIATPGLERAEETFDDLLFFGLQEVYHFPKWETLPYDEEEPHLEILAKHLDVFSALARWRRRAPRTHALPPPVIVTSIDSLMHKVLAAEEVEKRTVRLKWADRVNPERLADRLDTAGYEREPVVESRGEYSIRGGIIDVYPPNADTPLRIDLFGEEIESFRLFDAVTQRSTSDLGADAEIEIPPAKLREGMMEVLAADGRLLSILETLPKDTLVLLDEPGRFAQHAEHFEQAASRQYFDILNARQGLPHPERLLASLEEIEEALDDFQVLAHSVLPPDPAGPDAKRTRVEFDSSGFGHVAPSLETYLHLIRKQQAEDQQVVIVCDNEGQVHRFDEVLREHEMSAVAIPPDAAKSFAPLHRAVAEGYPDIVLVVGLLHSGFSLADERITFIPDREVFGRYKRRHTYRRLFKGAAVASTADIQRGDYVVHVENGIGRYIGMRRQEIDGRPIDLIEIEYADNSKLLVPVDKIRLVQKYSGTEQGAPPLDKLGSNRWQKRREKAREDVERMAQELLNLYARREMAARAAYPPDKAQQAEFEASFLYSETPDQLAAIGAVKNDMERERPMDRLVCGDVGYGKTEVAIRAVFKCVLEGRQAAILVPTTILALQHFNTFRERFASYPISVEMLSRFRGPKEQKQIIEKLKIGEVQVVIGTHRLLSKDIAFSDLGLVVVDEEQRFGVRHKERLKDLRTSVDFLTLTATPIPRTLYMALSGLRDLSVINTPPPDRYPIKTKIVHFEEDAIAEALLRELNRGGQVFFVHNRIHNIHEVEETLRKIVPHARIAVGHGQLSESELEEIMIDFYERKYDILISTTIIENGLDIPNCNTIVINRADAFGLAQLYQLRGRVGRAKRRAYAYLVVPKGQQITESAVKRLQAIEEFTELGAGFNIAMRDMEIRGTGNILGSEQHGAIDHVGFEMYCELLQDAVMRLKGEEPVQLADVEMKWKLDASLPPAYIPVESQRLAFYKRIASAQRTEELDDIATELDDRYGDRPAPVETLLRVARLRILAARAGIRTVVSVAAGLRLTPAPGECSPTEFASLLRDALAHAGMAPSPGAVRVDESDVLLAINSASGAGGPGGERVRLEALLRLLDAMDA